MDNNSMIFLLVILVFISAFFSASETAFSSYSRIKMKVLVNNGNKTAQKTLDLSENFTKVLSTILIVNDVVNVLSSTIATVLFINILGENGPRISTIVMTIVVLIFGDLIPKALAKSIPEKYALFVTPILSIFITVLTPLTFILSKFENIISKLNKNEEDSFDSDELITMVEEAQEDGDIKTEQADLITNAIEFNDLDVGEIFTPRVDVIAIKIDTPLDDIDKIYRESGFSRLPVYEDSIDDILGFLHEKDFYYLYYSKTKTSLKQVIKKVIYTSEHVKISALLKQLQTNKTHIAVVLDEYGGTAGIITMEDILEELVGEIYDEHDEVIEYYKKINENTYSVKGDLDIDDMFQYFGVSVAEEYDFNTVSGWVIHNLDKIPEVGESFEFMNLHVTVINADEKHVNEVEIIINENEEEKTNNN